MYSAGNKKIISTETYNQVVAAVRALKENEATKKYFEANDPFDDSLQRFYQLKFKMPYEGFELRCMCDELIVDHKNKVIYPIDLKTSSHTEWDFFRSFVQWRYDIQARLYWRIIRTNLLKDEYFKDFSFENYRFIVVNKNTLTPLVWEFPHTQAIGTLIDKYGRQYRDPYEIGKVLRQYLDLKRPVPNGIEKNGVNTIDCLYPEP
jgi:hypothetical protein